MNSKKEMLVALLLAVLLASGLGVMSYSLFGETPISEEPESVIVLDVYTQKGGLGPNMPSGSFALNESATLYGEIRDQLNKTGTYNKLIAFEAKHINKGTIMWRVEPTNTSGVATLVFRIPPDESFVGIWEIYARVEYNSTVLLDALTFDCNSQG